MPSHPKTRPTVGWRERVLLGDLCPVPIKAKVDTGAAAAALHAHDLSISVVHGETWAEFEIYPRQRSRADSAHVRLPVRSFKKVRSSTGHSERRPVIRTNVTIGGTTFPIDVSLTSRDAMGFRLLLGRAAIRRFVVDPSRSYLNDLPVVHEIGSE